MGAPPVTHALSQKEKDGAPKQQNKFRTSLQGFLPGAYGMDAEKERLFKKTVRKDGQKEERSGGECAFCVARE